MYGFDPRHSHVGQAGKSSEIIHVAFLRANKDQLFLEAGIHQRAQIPSYTCRHMLRCHELNPRSWVPVQGFSNGIHLPRLVWYGQREAEWAHAQTEPAVVCKSECAHAPIDGIAHPSHEEIAFLQPIIRQLVVLSNVEFSPKFDIRQQQRLVCLFSTCHRLSECGPASLAHMHEAYGPITKINGGLADVVILLEAQQLRLE